MELNALLAVAFLAGLLGSGHCLGMCGPFVMLLERQDGDRPSRAAVRRRFAYNSGRLLFYASLGGVLGAAGGMLATIAGVDRAVAALRFAAAMLVFLMGLNLLMNARWLAYLERLGVALWRRLAPFTRYVLPISSWRKAIAAGFLWGALPCGLVYSAAALAATSGSAPFGALVMCAFFLGTLPSLLVAGGAAQRLSAWSRRPSLRRPGGALMCALSLLAVAMPHWHFGHTGHAEDGAQRHHEHPREPHGPHAGSDRVE